MSGRIRGRFVRCDLPALLVFLLLVVFFLLSISARADAGGAVVAVAEAAGGVDLLKLIQTASNFTVAGILWYYSRLFYESNQKKDAQLLEVTIKATQVAADSNHLAANYEALVREIRPEARSASGRIAHNGG